MTQPISMDFKHYLERMGRDYETFKAGLSQISVYMPGGFWCVAGGAIRRAVLGEPLTTDYDIFFQSERYYNETVAKIDASDLGYFTKVKTTKNHTEYVDPDGLRFQLIKAFFWGDRFESVLDHFDFTICQWLYNPAELEVVTTIEALTDTIRKRLAVNKVTYPVSTMRRLIKYTSQGFYACSGCLNDLIEATAKVETEDTFEYVD